MEKKQRLVILDVLTLMATILVVMGHHKFMRESISWYPVYDKIIYSFHMGFFMTISGFLIKYTFPSKCRWREYVGKKAKKFIPAYFAVGLLAALLSFKSFGGLAKDMLMLVANPGKGPIQIIWYIYVLLMYYCLAPFVFRLSTKQRWWVLAVSLIPASLYNYMPEWLCMSSFFRLLPFFLLGGQLADYHKSIQTIADWKVFLLSLPFLAFIISCILLQGNPMKGGLGKLLTSALSLPLMYWIARKLVRITKIADLSIRFSSYVYSVYLWQMFFINGIWLVWQKVGPSLTNTTAIVYIICSVAITIVGIVVLVKMYRWLFGKLVKRKN